MNLFMKDKQNGRIGYKKGGGGIDTLHAKWREVALSTVGAQID